MRDMTRKHYSRLRFYWQGRSQGIHGQMDSIDLDLAAAELIVRKETQVGGVPYYAVTLAGEKELAAEKEREIERRRPHHDLASRLASWLRDQGRVTWENIELLVPRADGTRQAIRPDVFSLVATYNAKHLNPCVHEIKISRSDFLSDVSRIEKRTGYSQIAEVVYYAAPIGMIEVQEVPPECGLLVEVSSGQFKVLKRPKKKNVELTTHHFIR